MSDAECHAAANRDGCTECHADEHGPPHGDIHRKCDADAGAIGEQHANASARVIPDEPAGGDEHRPAEHDGDGAAQRVAIHDGERHHGPHGDGNQHLHDNRDQHADANQYGQRHRDLNRECHAAADCDQHAVGNRHSHHDGDGDGDGDRERGCLHG